MSKGRLVFALLLTISIGAAIVGRLFLVQIIKGDYYKALAMGQQKSFSSIPAKRGEIFFRGGEELATNQIINSAYLVPNEVKNKAETAQMLAEVLDLKEESVKEKLAKDSLYELLKNKLTPQEIEKLTRLNITGVYLGQELLRFYPQGDLCSQTIGFVDKDHQGQYGLEGFWQKTLGEREGTLEEEKGLGNLTIFSLSKEEAQNGSDLVLTLDYQIQFMAEKLLKDAKTKLAFDSATIIVIDPTSGEILALANDPGFDPNHYGEEKNLANFQNSAIQKLFEPGSVFKPITMASAIQENKITPQTTYIDKGVVKIGNTPIYNYANRTYGENTMTQVLEKSINTGAVWAFQQLGSELFLKYLEKFDLFEKTGVDLQGEVFSQNLEFKKGYDINFATASFGQGIDITPIQLVKAFSAIANGGKMVKPHLVKEIIDENGNAKEILPEISSNIISQKTSSEVVTMMMSVVDNGYGKRAKIPGYFIAGKTGTAQVSWPSLGIQKAGYSDKTIQSFIGFAPALNPKFLILVKLDNPNEKTAEYSAVPIFHDLARYIIDLKQIPPDYEP
jgi:cell division protein FtsI/penicillin-binding protein 2